MSIFARSASRSGGGVLAPDQNQSTQNRWLFVVAAVLTFLKTMPFILQIGTVDLSNPGDIAVPIYFYYRILFLLSMIYVFAFVYQRAALDMILSMLPPVLLCLQYLLSSTWSADAYISVRASFEFWACVALAFFLNLGFTTRGIAQILLHVLGISLLLSVIWVVLFPGVAIHAAFDLIQDGHEGEWRGIYVHKNTLGAIAGFTIPMVLGPGRELVRSRLLLLAYLVSAALCVINAKSGTGMTLVAVGLSVVFVLSIKSRYWRKVIFGMVIVASFVAATFGDQLLGPIFELLGKDPTLTGRTNLWETALMLFSEKPLLGHGYPAVSDPNVVEAFMDSYAAPNAHNAYLHVLVESGLVGITLWVLCLYKAVQGLRPALRAARLEPELIFFINCIISLLIAGITEIQPLDVTNSLLGIYLMIALVTMACLPRARTSEARPAPLPTATQSTRPLPMVRRWNRRT